MFSQIKAWFINHDAGKDENRPHEILNALDLQPGQIVADLGSGGGYFTLEFAKKILPRGKVFAVDTDHNLLNFILLTAKKLGLTNIFAVPIAQKELPKFPIQLDLLFLRNVYHHLENRIFYFQNLKKQLKPDGKIIIIDFHGKGFWQKFFGHFTRAEKINDDLSKAVFRLIRSYDFLPEQSFSIFSIENSSQIV